MNMVQRYLGSKGSRLSRQEEPPLGSMVAPCHLEESASHHLMTPRYSLNDPQLILRTLIFMISHHVTKTCRCSK